MTHCCPHEEKQASSDSSRHGHSHAAEKKADWLLRISMALCVMGYGWHMWAGDSGPAMLATYAHATFELLNKMWWGVLLGIFFVGLMDAVPRELVMSAFGRSGSLKGILRATLAGVFLDLCSHGILLVGMKLYERGASLGQVMAFLIASPWNSLSLTFVMVALMGAGWTLSFILLSLLIAIISGLVFERLVANGTLPSNPYSHDLPKDFSFSATTKVFLQQASFGPEAWLRALKNGLASSRMIVRWLLLGVVLAALIRATVDAETFATYFGSSLAGLGLTILAATIIEVCSEGSTPIAADLLTRARAPGNSFAFLMAGVATDYTEVIGLKETTKSWKIALFLPVVTLPQVLIIAFLLNQLGH